MSRLQSMTGFARAARDHDAGGIVWEIKSVNGRSLEARFRLPPGFERIEPMARQRLQKCFARGNVQASLTFTQSDALRRPVVDEDFLKEVAALAGRLQEQFGTAPATATGSLPCAGSSILPIPWLTKTCAPPSTRRSLPPLTMLSGGLKKPAVRKVGHWKPYCSIRCRASKR